jgi:hypothetical protein
MRDARAIHDRIRFQLRESLRRPRMWHPETQDQAVAWFAQLQMLAWIDERDGAVARERGRPVAGGRALPDEVDGVAAALRKALPDEPGVVWEAASVWAEIAWRLGYLELERSMQPAELTSLLGGVHDFWLRRDHTSTSLLAELGPPALLIGGLALEDRPTAGVLCYASLDRQGPWVCFDFVDDEPHPLLRSVRRSDRPLDDGGLLLTAFGKSRGRHEPVFGDPLAGIPEDWERTFRRSRIHLVTEDERGE